MTTTIPRRLIAVVASLLLTAAAVTIPAPAQAEDQRPCVSKAEYFGAKRLTPRTELERRWEVTALGHTEVIPYLGLRATIYKRCGYMRRDAWFGVQYNRDRRVVLFIWFNAAGPASHTGERS